ncbi:MAG: polysaccharide biosynthesis tyrosine autokinase [Planctomycetota bacterium]
MLDQSQTESSNYDANGSDNELDTNSGESLAAVLWRYKWLLSFFTVVGTGVGYWMYKQKPTTYRATTQLMFKSDTPLTLDATTGAVSGGIPSGNLMQQLIISDAIVGSVASNPELKSIPSLEAKTDEQIVNMVRAGIRFQTITDPRDSRDRMIAALNFEGRDPEVCVAAVNAMSSAIDEHFDAEREMTINGVGTLIKEAQGKLQPQLQSLESEYENFRDTAQLEWGTDGQAINPHRERQFMLQSHQLELEQKMRSLQSDLRFAKSTADANSDPIMVAQIIGQLDDALIDDVATPNADAIGGDNPLQNDLELQKFEVEKTLLPLKIKLEQLAVEWGDSHPSVKLIKTQIDSSQNELNRLNAQIAERRKEIAAQATQGNAGQARRKLREAKAAEAVEAYIRGHEQRLIVLDEEMTALGRQIATEKTAADELKKVEDKDAAYSRQVERLHGMWVQLESKLASLKLVDVNGGIIVEPLLATGQAYVTGPDLRKDLILFGMAGLGVAGLLAVLFEASAKMFRSAEEVQRELRVPVLTHVPLDEGRVPQTKGVESELASLDPKLAVVHRPYSPAAEAIRGVRTSLLFDHRQFKSKVFQVTSPLPGDGKSTMVANIGCSLAQSGKRTLLIDLDLRSPRLSLRFNLEGGQGLTNVLNGESAPTEAVHQTPIENLDVLPCGPLPANPAEALTLAELGEVFQWARENYDFVIVDTPPLLMVSDPAVVTTYTDAAMLILRIRRRCKPNSKEAIAMLRAAGARVMGCVINKVDDISGGLSYKSSASGSYQSIGYGYGDRYRRRYQQEANVQDTYIVRGKTTTPAVDRAEPMEDISVSPGTAEEPRPLMPERSDAVYEDV